MTEYLENGLVNYSSAVEKELSFQHDFNKFPESWPFTLRDSIPGLKIGIPGLGMQILG